MPADSLPAESKPPMSGLPSSSSRANRGTICTWIWSRTASHRV
jgi:hypothetical protein